MGGIFVRIYVGLKNRETHTSIEANPEIRFSYLQDPNHWDCMTLEFECKNHEEAKKAEKILSSLIEKLKVAKAALKFYADDSKWINGEMMKELEIDGIKHAVHRIKFGPDKAKQALEEIGN